MKINQKYKASFKQTLCCYLCGSLGLIAFINNTVKMRRYRRNYQTILNALVKFKNNFDHIQRLKDKNITENALLQTVFPSFPRKYFNNALNTEKYTKKVGKFYEDLEFDSFFQGALRHKGKQYPIIFEMNKPSVGFELADNALKFDEQGIKFHRNQTIAVYGQLSYSRDQKKYTMKTKMLGLDWIEIQKFNELKLIATIISTFYFSILLGVSLCMFTRFYSLDFELNSMKGNKTELLV